MSWLWEAAQQAASGDVAGAWETASSGAQADAEDVVDAVSSTIEDGAAAMGVGGGSKGEPGGDVVSRIYETLDELSGGNLDDTVGHVGDAMDALASGDITGAATSTGGALRSTSEGIGTTIRTAGEAVEEAVDDTAASVGAGAREVAGAVEEGLATVGAGVDALDEATRDQLAHVGESVGDLADALRPDPTSGTTVADATVGTVDDVDLGSTLAGAARATETIETHEDAVEVAATYDEVTAQMGLATAVTLDEVTGGGMSSAASALDRARTELAAGRYDDALVEVERAARDYGRISRRVVDEGDLESRIIRSRQVDEVRGEGHDRLALVVDRFVRRVPRPTADPEPPARAGGEVDPVSERSVALLTDDHLPRSAAALRRAATADPTDRESATAAAEAEAHLRAAGPATARSLVAIVDERGGGHLGDTAGLAGRAARALREGELDEARTLSRQVAHRHARAVDEVTAVDGSPLDGGHAEVALGRLEEAASADTGGDHDRARDLALEAADELDAAVVSYDAHVDRSVDELVGSVAPEPVRARAAQVVDDLSGGSLSEGRAALERGAADARAGSIPSALARGREARDAMERAEAAYAAPDVPARLHSRLRRQEHEVQESDPVPELAPHELTDLGPSVDVDPEAFDRGDLVPDLDEGPSSFAPEL